MKTIERESIFEAWFAGAKHLEQAVRWEEFNLILSIKKPTRVSKEDLVIRNSVDRLLRKAGKSLNTVADTIFPATEYKRHGANGVYEIYPEQVYPLIKPANPWGIYAHRLLRQKAKNGAHRNPLKELVELMKSEMRSGKKRAAYEISAMTDIDELAIYQNDYDHARSYGGPCLSHLSFKLDPTTRTVHLTVLYRSHYYIERALGNLLGLARLHDFVASEAGLKVGELTCVSTYAKLDTKSKVWGKDEVRKLLKARKT